MEKVPTQEPEIITIEVIADYPGMILVIGEQLTVYKKSGMFYATKEDKVDYRDYPALFKVVETKL